MINKIFPLIFAIIQVNIDLHLTSVSENKSSLFLDCLQKGYCCDPDKSNPCNSTINKCEKIKWGPYRSVFACIKPIKLGDSCINNLDCVNVENSHCNANTCKCMDNYMPFQASKCLALLDGHCQKNEDCYNVNTICTNYRCKCKPSFFEKANQCAPTTYGKYCQFDNDCKDLGHMQCTPENICDCHTRHILENNATCEPLLDGFCRVKERCKVENSECIDNKCQCGSGYIALTFTKCLRSSLGKTCNTRNDCLNIGNAECSNANRCICRKNSVVINNATCVPTLGGKCHRNNNCITDNSICVDFKCQCKPEYHESDYDCVMNTIGNSCEINPNCGDINKFACSEDKKCVCKKNLVLFNNETCKSKLGGICESNEECFTKNASCMDNQCRCKPGYSSENDTCNVSMLGKSCKTDIDCYDINHIKCSHKGRCRCRPHHKSVLLSCASLLQGFCEDDEKCIVNNSVCIDNTCQCKDRFIPGAPDSCLPSPLGKKCENDVECEQVLYAECSKFYLCVCKKNYIMKDYSRCEPLINEFCYDNDSCKIKDSSCVNNTCQCNVGFMTTNKHKCVPSTLGKTCYDSFDCNDIWHEKCSDEEKICVCKPNHKIVNKAKCVPLLGAICMPDDVCKSENSICLDHECQCRPTFERVSNDFCKPSKLGHSCTTDHDCEDLGHMQCSDEHVCECDRFHKVLNEAICLPALQGICTDNRPCVVENSVCIDNECLCQDGYIRLSYDRCIQSFY